MKKVIFFLIFSIIFPCISKAQELFAYTEPASNMASKAIGLRLSNYIMRDDVSSNYSLYVNPEIMVGLSKKIMLHGEMFISNQHKNFLSEGGAFYMKYRFYSNDDIHSHFRMALYGRYASNNSELRQPAIDLNGRHSGYELGFIATKLINKVALSSTISFVEAMNNTNGHDFISIENSGKEAINYGVSIGKLFLPKEYINYNQINVNGMMELLCQSNLHSHKTFVDIAPVVQFVLFSKMRIDLGYRFSLVNDLFRSASNGGLLRVEYNFFNVF